MKTIKNIGPWMLALALLLSACRGAPATPATPTQDANLVRTAAAATANARLTETAMAQPTNTPNPTPTPTPEPTTAVPTIVAPTATETPAGTPTVASNNGQYKAEFVTDVTINDGTQFNPKATFTKTWRLQNMGTTTWTTDFKLIFFGGNQMGGPSTVNLPSEVAPTGLVDVSVNLVAPDKVGKYTGYWMLQAPDETYFGVGPKATDAFWVIIEVVEGTPQAATSTPTPGTATPGSDTSGTPAPTATTGSSSDLISGVTLAVDQETVTGSCPHTYKFTSQFTLREQATVTYGLAADTGYDVDLPAPVTVNMGPGTYVLPYELEFTASMTGWVEFRISAPIDITSNRVNVSLTCQQ